MSQHKVLVVGNVADERCDYAVQTLRAMGYAPALVRPIHPLRLRESVQAVAQVAHANRERGMQADWFPQVPKGLAKEALALAEELSQQRFSLRQEQVEQFVRCFWGIDPESVVGVVASEATWNDPENPFTGPYLPFPNLQVRHVVGHEVTVFRPHILLCVGNQTQGFMAQQMLAERLSVPKEFFVLVNVPEDDYGEVIHRSTSKVRLINRRPPTYDYLMNRYGVGLSSVAGVVMEEDTYDADDHVTLGCYDLFPPEAVLMVMTRGRTLEIRDWPTS